METLTSFLRSASECVSVLWMSRTRTAAVSTQTSLRTPSLSTLALILRGLLLRPART